MTSPPQVDGEPTALADLLARVEAATAPDRELDADIAIWQFPHLAECPRSLCGGWQSPEWGLIAPASEYTASLDAALALVERALPGAWVELSGPRKYLNIPTPVPNRWRAECGACGWGATPVLAVLAALLKAVSKPTLGGREAVQPIREDVTQSDGGGE